MPEPLLSIIFLYEKSPIVYLKLIPAFFVMSVNFTSLFWAEEVSVENIKNRK